jgi:hypothetical protein
MANEADRIPVEDRYLHALGRATYNFAYLEWGIVWLTETIEVGFLNEVRNLTAGQIAKRFSQSLGQLASKDPDKAPLQELASLFERLVEDRNRLMHGNPFTAAGGEQRLLYDGKHGRKDWTIELIGAFSDQTAAASIEAGRLLHGGRLAGYCNRTPI